MTPRPVPGTGAGGSGPGVDSLQAGLWVPPGAPFCGQIAQPGVAGRGYYVRFACPKSMTITKIAFFVTAAATADDPCDVGVYDAGASRLGSSGSVSGQLNSTGMKQLSLPVAIPLAQGLVYYAAFAYGAAGGTIAQLQMTTCANALIFALFGSGVPNIEQRFGSADFPLPAAQGGGGGLDRGPILALLQ